MPPVLPRAILFDWDNTLVDSWPCIIEALNITLRAMGHEPWTPEECHARVALSLREAFPPLFGDRWPEAQQIFYDAFAAVHIERLTPLPDAEALLVALREAGVVLSVVSNKTGKYLRTEAEHLGWDRYFHRLVGAGDAVRDKPAADPVTMALSESGHEPGPDVWFIGDSAVDMQCGIGTGCLPVLLHPDPPGSDAFAAFPPKLSFTTIAQLMDYLHFRTVPNARQR